MSDPSNDEPRSLSERSETERGEPEALQPGAAPLAERPEADDFPPTLREVMVRPRWLAMLALCLVVAAGFAWLGQWQLGRALRTDPTPAGATEEVQPLADVVGPGEYLTDTLIGQRVLVTGSWIPRDFLIVESRFNDGAKGYWVTGQLRISGTAKPTSVAVAVGWASTLEQAQSAAKGLEHTAAAGGVEATVTGRLIADEGPTLPPPGAHPQTMTHMSPAALLSQWHDIQGLDVYRQYLASESAPPSLVDIHSPAPDEGSGVNWLNIFYAIEWAVFAGFAFYLWYRLARDAWERELEELEEGAPEAS